MHPLQGRKAQLSSQLEGTMLENYEGPISYCDEIRSITYEGAAR